MVKTADPKESNIPSIDEAEKLGRGVFSSKEERICRRTGKVPFSVFLDQTSSKDISVERLSIAPIDEAIRHGDAIAEGRTGNRSFYGWAIVIAREVTNTGCEVIPTPLPGNSNPYHADIRLPETAVNNREKQQEYARELARHAVWKKRP